MVGIRSSLVLWWPHDAKLMESPPSNSSNPPVIMNDGHKDSPDAEWWWNTSNSHSLAPRFRIASTFGHFCLFMREWAQRDRHQVFGGELKLVNGGDMAGATGFGSGKKRSIIHCKRIMKRGHPSTSEKKKQIKIRVTSSREWQISKDLIWLLNKQS